MPKIAGLIFDFDGVIADSEGLSHAVLAEALASLGLVITRDHALERYQGRRWDDAMAMIEHDLGQPLPDGFSAQLGAALMARFHAELTEVAGAASFIRAYDRLPRCVASSSSPDRFAVCLDILGLRDAFGSAVFSAEQVARGKPHPDIFLHAAAQIGVLPAACLVIEDSLSGVRAALAAGMPVLGLSAASHLRSGHGDRLREAGATYVAASWAEAESIVATLLR